VFLKLEESILNELLRSLLREDLENSKLFVQGHSHAYLELTGILQNDNLQLHILSEYAELTIDDSEGSKRHEAD
jgi:hypothetical protein